MKLQEHTRGLEDRTWIDDLRKCFRSGRAGASPHLGGTFSGVHMTHSKRQVAKSFARFPINKSQNFQCLLFLAMTFCSRKYMKRWVASVNPCLRTCLGDFSGFSSVSLGSLVCLVFKCKVQPRQQAWKSIGGSCGWWMVECSTRCGVETSSEIFQLAWQRRSLKGSGAQVGICLFLFWWGSWIHRFWGLSVGDTSAGKDCMLHEKKFLKLLGLEPVVRGSWLKRGSTESQLGPKCNKLSDCFMKFRSTTKCKFAKRPFLIISSNWFWFDFTSQGWPACYFSSSSRRLCYFCLCFLFSMSFWTFRLEAQLMSLCKESTWSVAQRIGVIRGSGHVGIVRGLRSRMRTKRKWSWAQSKEILQNESPYDSVTFSWYMWWTWMNIYIYIYIIWILLYNIYYIYTYTIIFKKNHILILLLNFYFWIPFWNCHLASSFRSLPGCNRGCQRTDPTHPHGQGTETSDTWHVALKPSTNLS